MRAATQIVRASVVKIVALLVISTFALVGGINLAGQLSKNPKQQIGALAAAIFGLAGITLCASSFLHALSLAKLDGEGITVITIPRWRKYYWTSIKLVRIDRRLLLSSIVLEVQREGKVPLNVTIPAWLSDERAIDIAQKIESFREAKA